MRLGWKGKLKKPQRMALSVPVCVTADWSSDEFASGYNQYLSDQTK
jgi:hypothetical protein